MQSIFIGGIKGYLSYQSAPRLDQKVSFGFDILFVAHDFCYRTVNRSTFTCPICKEGNLDRKDLLKHVTSKHKKQPGVCPICVV